MDYIMKIKIIDRFLDQRKDYVNKKEYDENIEDIKLYLKIKNIDKIDAVSKYLTLKRKFNIEIFSNSYFQSMIDYEDIIDSINSYKDFLLDYNFGKHVYAIYNTVFANEEYEYLRKYYVKKYLSIYLSLIGHPLKFFNIPTAFLNIIYLIFHDMTIDDIDFLFSCTLSALTDYTFGYFKKLISIFKNLNFQFSDAMKIKNTLIVFINIDRYFLEGYDELRWVIKNKDVIHIPLYVAYVKKYCEEDDIYECMKGLQCSEREENIANSLLEQNIIENTMNKLEKMIDQNQEKESELSNE